MDSSEGLKAFVGVDTALIRQLFKVILSLYELPASAFSNLIASHSAEDFFSRKYRYNIM